jgi:CDP-diacylglycerol--serine O-phosphatidyltransferase
LIGFLMVSRLPVFSGKSVKMRVPPEMVLPVFVSVVFFIALLVSYPWHILSCCTVIYLLSLPWGWKSYRDQERSLAAAQSAAATDAATPPGPAATFPATATDADHDDRPTRLN